eukprot:11223967-Lingulodinium_polyedra.AAC.1
MLACDPVPRAARGTRLRTPGCEGTALRDRRGRTATTRRGALHRPLPGRAGAAGQREGAVDAGWRRRAARTLRTAARPA